LVDAAARCIARDGLSAASVAAVAAEAGVSRQTVYRYFAGRDDLASGAILAAAEELRSNVCSRLDALTDPADMIVEALVLGLDAVSNDPVLRAIRDSAALDGFIARQFTGPAGIAWTHETLAPAIKAAGWKEADADAGLELILRIFLSLIVSPLPARGPEEIRTFLYRYLVPGLGLATSDEI
jgi:AcrR family transcriptional regulator